MRRTVGIRLPNAAVSNVSRQTLIPFSTSSGDGGGRGRGRGGGPFSMPGTFNVIGKAHGESSSDPPKPDSPVPPVSGHGHGRGKPLPSASPLPGFSSFVASIKPPSAGRGRKTDPAAAQPPADESRPPFAADSEPKKPIFFKREGSVSVQAPNLSSDSSAGELEADHKLPGNILSVLSGAGRGKPTKQPGPEAEGKEFNRHLRRQRDPAPATADSTVEKRPIQSREDAVKNARRLLSKDDPEGSIGVRGRGGFRGRGAFGRGRGRDRGRGRFRGRERDDLVEDAEGSYVSGLYLGDNADGEKLAKRLGPEMMNQLAEGFEEMAGRVLPSPLDDELLDAFDINCAVSEF